MNLLRANAVLPGGNRAGPPPDQSRRERPRPQAQRAGPGDNPEAPGCVESVRGSSGWTASLPEALGPEVRREAVRAGKPVAGLRA